MQPTLVPTTGKLSADVFSSDERIKHFRAMKAEDLGEDQVESFMSLGKEIVARSKHYFDMVEEAQEARLAIGEGIAGLEDTLDERERRREETRKRREFALGVVKFSKEENLMQKRAEYIHHLMESTQLSQS